MKIFKGYVSIGPLNDLATKIIACNRNQKKKSAVFKQYQMHGELFKILKKKKIQLHRFKDSWY